MKVLPYTLDLVNTDGVNEKGMELLRKLNVNRFPGKQPDGSIMSYKGICTCDDDYLCEHRLQVIEKKKKKKKK